MIIYGVTSGSGDSYARIAYFSRRELAEAFIERCRVSRHRPWFTPEELEIEEFHVDEDVNSRPIRTYGAAIFLDDGTIRGTWDAGIDLMEPDGPCKVGSSRHPSGRAPSGEWLYRDVLVVISPISEDHARKVAVEKRQDWLRTRAAGATQERS